MNTRHLPDLARTVAGMLIACILFANPSVAQTTRTVTYDVMRS